MTTGFSIRPYSEELFRAALFHMINNDVTQNITANHCKLKEVGLGRLELPTSTMSM